MASIRAARMICRACWVNMGLVLSAYGGEHDIQSVAHSPDTLTAYSTFDSIFLCRHTADE